MSDFDVIVVGAGPAGSALASFLGRRGVRTALLDKERFPREKVCGDYMSPEAVGVLDRLGILPAVEAAPHRQLKGMLVHSYDGTRSRGTYRPFGRFAPSRPYGIAIRRVLLDEILFRHAQSFATVTTFEGFRVDRLLREGGRVVGVEGSGGRLSAPLVVGADGVRSVVARELGLSEMARDHERFAVSAYFTGVPHEDYGELHLGLPGYFAMAPVDRDVVHFNFVVERGSIAEARGDLVGYFRRHAVANPLLRRRLAWAAPIGPVRATGPMARRCRGTVAPGSILIGDAAEFVDPFTGEGIFIGLRSAELAAAAIADGRLDRFEAVRTAEFAEKFRLCWRIQKYLYRPRIANYIIRRLAANPGLADRLTAVTGDYLPPGEVATLGFYAALLNPFTRVAAAL